MSLSYSSDSYSSSSSGSSYSADSDLEGSAGAAVDATGPAGDASGRRQSRSHSRRRRQKAAATGGMAVPAASIAAGGEDDELELDVDFHLAMPIANDTYASEGYSSDEDVQQAPPAPTQKGNPQPQAQQQETAKVQSQPEPLRLQKTQQQQSVQPASKTSQHHPKASASTDSSSGASSSSSSSTAGSAVVVPAPAAAASILAAQPLAHGQCAVCLALPESGADVAKVLFCGECCPAATLCQDCDRTRHAQGPEALHYRQPLQPPRTNSNATTDGSQQQAPLFTQPLQPPPASGIGVRVPRRPHDTATAVADDDDGADSSDYADDEWQSVALPVALEGPEDAADGEQKQQQHQPHQPRALLLPGNTKAEEEKQAVSLISPARLHGKAGRALARMPARPTFHPSLLGNPYDHPPSSARVGVRPRPPPKRKEYMYRPATARSGRSGNGSQSARLPQPPSERQQPRPGSALSPDKAHALAVAQACVPFRPSRPMVAPASARGPRRPHSAVHHPAPPPPLPATASSSLPAAAAAAAAFAGAGGAVPVVSVHAPAVSSPRYRELLAPTAVASGATWGARTTSLSQARLYAHLGALKMQLSRLAQQRQDLSVAIARRKDRRAQLRREEYNLARMGDAEVREDPRARVRREAEAAKAAAAAAAAATSATAAETDEAAVTAGASAGASAESETAIATVDSGSNAAHPPSSSSSPSAPVSPTSAAKKPVENAAALMAAAVATVPAAAHMTVAQAATAAIKPKTPRRPATAAGAATGTAATATASMVSMLSDENFLLQAEVDVLRSRVEMRQAASEALRAEKEQVALLRRQHAQATSEASAARAVQELHLFKQKQLVADLRAAGVDLRRALDERARGASEAHSSAESVRRQADQLELDYARLQAQLDRAVALARHKADHAGSQQQQQQTQQIMQPSPLEPRPPPTSATRQHIVHRPAAAIAAAPATAVASSAS